MHPRNHNNENNDSSYNCELNHRGSWGSPAANDVKHFNLSKEMSQNQANLCRNMQPLAGLWRTPEGFTLAPCNQVIQREQTIGCFILSAVAFCQIKTTFPISPLSSLMRIQTFQQIFPPNLIKPCFLFLTLILPPINVFMMIYRG